MVSAKGSMPISQIMPELNIHLGIWVHLSKVSHSMTGGRSKISKESVRRCSIILLFAWYQEGNWQALLPTTKFVYNINYHMSIGLSQSKKKYGYNPMYRSITLTKQYIPEAEGQLRKIEGMHTKLFKCLQAAQSSMKPQFENGFNPTTRWEVGDQVWLISKKFFTMRSSRKLEYQWFGIFKICQQVSTSAYQLNLPLSIKDVHLVFPISVLQNLKLDPITVRKLPTPKNMEFNGLGEWGVNIMLDCKRHNIKLK